MENHGKPLYIVPRWVNLEDPTDSDGLVNFKVGPWLEPQGNARAFGCRRIRFRLEAGAQKAAESIIKPNRSSGQWN